MMRVFIARHHGVWMGGLSVIVAPSEDKALDMLKPELRRASLPEDGIELSEIDLKSAAATILDNGDY